MSWDEEPVEEAQGLRNRRRSLQIFREELEEYIAVLDAERLRVEAMLVAKNASRSAASSVFKN